MGGGTSFTRFLENIGLIQAEKQRLDFEVTDSGTSQRRIFVQLCSIPARRDQDLMQVKQAQPWWLSRHDVSRLPGG
jgi:hypothetical protein